MEFLSDQSTRSGLRLSASSHYLQRNSIMMLYTTSSRAELAMITWTIDEMIENIKTYRRVLECRNTKVIFILLFSFVIHYSVIILYFITFYYHQPNGMIFNVPERPEIYIQSNTVTEVRSLMKMYPFWEPLNSTATMQYVVVSL